MYVAVDDTDSVRGNCTTFLATEIIKELSDLDLIGNPRLVRLNPAVPWKTRGNGALIMEFGKGTGRRKTAGNIGGNDIFAFQTGKTVDSDGILERLIPIVDGFTSEDAQPGLLLSEERPMPAFYEMGCRTIVDRADVDAEIERIGAKTYTANGGRGLIGCVCGLAWRPKDKTYEILAYRERERWGTPRTFDPASVERMDRELPSTFNNWSKTEERPAIFPSTPCPVLFGIRGDVEGDLLPAAESLDVEPIERWMLFLTNQGTDDHISADTLTLKPNASYSVYGEVATRAKRIGGGHAFIDIDTDYGRLTCAIYEPAKNFRDVFDALVPGDFIQVFGELREEPRTLNVEKIRVTRLAEDMRKVSNPLCGSCRRTMESAGSGAGYRCRRCGTKSKDPVMVSEPRKICVGWYEPPETARRHLSKPLKRMGLEQPVHFVERRI